MTAFFAGLMLLASSTPSLSSNPVEEPQSTIIGELIDENGEGVPGVEVELYVDRDGEVTVSRARSGDGGAFTFESVAPGDSLWILVHCADICLGYPNQEVELSEESVTRVEVRVERSEGGSAIPNIDSKFWAMFGVRWLLASLFQLVLAGTFFAGLIFLLRRYRSTLTEGSLLTSSAKVAVILVVVPWSLLLLCWLSQALAPASSVWLVLLTPFVVYERIAALLTGQRELFGEWFMPTDWRGVVLVVAFYLALSIAVAAILRAVAKRKAAEAQE